MATLHTFCRTWLIALPVLGLGLSSCSHAGLSVSKRLYRSGYHLQWSSGEGRHNAQDRHEPAVVQHFDSLSYADQTAVLDAQPQDRLPAPTLPVLRAEKRAARQEKAARLLASAISSVPAAALPSSCRNGTAGMPETKADTAQTATKKNFFGELFGMFILLAFSVIFGGLAIVLGGLALFAGIYFGYWWLGLIACLLILGFTTWMIWGWWHKKRE